MPESAPRRRRNHYSAEQRELVRLRYPLAVTREEKVALAQELGIDLTALYHLASRLRTQGGGLAAPFDAEGDGLAICHDPVRLMIREDPATLVFTPDEDAYISEHYGCRRVEQIAFVLNHSESAVAYRALQLGLRNYAQLWPADRAGAWLGLTEEELRGFGVTIYACHDRHRELRIKLVETHALVKLLLGPAPARPAPINAPAPAEERMMGFLLRERNADRFFLREIVEAVMLERRGEPRWTSDRWVSHGLTCLNPFAGASFDLFYDGGDAKMSAAYLHPAQLTRENIDQLLY